MNNKRTLVNDIVFLTLARIFCTILFTNNNIKVVIQIHTFLMDHRTEDSVPLLRARPLFYVRVVI